MATVSALVDKYTSPRAKRIMRYAAYVAGTQYDGREPFLSQRADAPPILERAPCVVYPIVDIAIASYLDFCLGEGRFPTFATEDESSQHEAIELVTKQTKFHTRMRRAFRTALSCGSACAIVGIRNGRLFISVEDPAHCTPTINEDDVCEQLEICYPFVEEYFDGREKTYKKRVMLFRRVIDATHDTVFEPVEAPSFDLDITWTERERVAHGLGFCPVVWYRTLTTGTAIDGHPLHENICDEIDAMNFSLSQRYRASLYSGDPQIIEIGVDREESAGGTGRTASVTTENGWFSVRTSGTPARRKGPGTVWTYERPDAKVEMLTLGADALRAIDDNARDLKAKISEALAFVDIDIESAKIAGDASGKALEILFRRHTDRCDTYRSDFGDGFIVPVMSMLLAIMGVAVDCLDLVWGPYFKPTVADYKSDIELCQAAISAGLMTKKMAVERLKSRGLLSGDVSELIAENEDEPEPVSEMPEDREVRAGDGLGHEDDSGMS